MAAKGIPADVLDLLAAADKRKGFPAGTMLSVLQQEIGGRPDILANPAAYHYEADAQGRRIAPHTGKVSTAFGPFGILESTAADPGYGVAPLKDKSLPEQVRFYADYLDARSASAGSLAAGLAGVGEGEKYSRQVARRRDVSGGKASPIVEAFNQDPTNQIPPVAPEAPVEVAAPVPPVAAPAVAAAPAQPVVDEWERFRAASAKPEIQPQVLAAYGQQPVMPTVQAPVFNTMPAPAQRLDFRPFLAMRRWAA